VANDITFYWLPNCLTCQKASAYLNEAGEAVSSYRDLKAEPLSREEVEGLADLVGSASALFSRRARKYRTMGLDERELTTDEMLRLMTEEYTFIKRPVLVRDNRGIAGFTPKSYDRFFGKQ
jgi:arsenate reductase